VQQTEQQTQAVPLNKSWNHKRLWGQDWGTQLPYGGTPEDIGVFVTTS